MKCFDTKPKDGYGYIYKYTSPSGKSYIGQTINSLKERAGSKGQGYTNCSVFFMAIQKYGFNNFKIEILEEVSLSEIDNKETYYINKFNTLVPNGYNIQQGGKVNYKDRKKCTSAIVKYDSLGRYVQTFNSVKEAANEVKSCYQAIENVLMRKRSHHKGFIYRYVGEEAPAPIKIINTHGRLVGQYTLNNEFINTFTSANEAARSIGKNSNAGRNIRAVCLGDRKTAFGYKWKYLE